MFVLKYIEKDPKSAKAAKRQIICAIYSTQLLYQAFLNYSIKDCNEDKVQCHVLPFLPICSKICQNYCYKGDFQKKVFMLFGKTSVEK